MTVITKYFDRNLKKRDISDNLNQEESSKKLKDESLNTSRASDIPDEVFTESLKPPDCVNILFSCIKNVEREITQIFENTKEFKEGQIKGKKHLAELTEAVDFISNKFEEHEYLYIKNISITESLAATQMKKLKEAREIYEFKNVWISD